MKRRYIGLLVFISLLSAGPLQAQGRPQPLSADTLAAREVRFLSEKLALSPKQSASLQTGLKGFHQEQQGLSVNTKDTAQRKQQAQAARKAHWDILQKILTPAQWELYEKGVEEQRAAFLKHAKEKNIPVRELEEQ